MIHYSGQAGRARAAAIAGHEDDFEKFKNSASLELLLATAKDVLDKAVPANLRDKTLARLEGSKLSLSRKQLIFIYKLAFEATGKTAAGCAVMHSQRVGMFRPDDRRSGGHQEQPARAGAGQLDQAGCPLNRRWRATIMLTSALWEPGR